MIQYRPRAETDRIILHASHTAPDQRNLETFLQVQGRVKGLLNTGYHYLILADGKLVGTRPDHTIGSHTPGFNRSSVGVCLAGGLDPEGGQVDTFTADQKETLRFLIGYLNKNYGPGLKLVAHSELGRHRFRVTQCPPLDIDQLRKEMQC